MKWSDRYKHFSINSTHGAGVQLGIVVTVFLLCALPHGSLWTGEKVHTHPTHPGKGPGEKHQAGGRPQECGCSVLLEFREERHLPLLAWAVGAGGGGDMQAHSLSKVPGRKESDEV